jgi:hypothetical protein
VTTTDTTITKDMTPAEAARLLAKLEQGHWAPWWSTHETLRGSAEYQSRFQNAAEVDGVFRDLLWETLNSGMRRPGESVERFAERAAAEAKLADARNGGTQMASRPITRQTSAEVRPGRAGISPDDDVARLLRDPGTLLGQACARAFSEDAAAHVRELRKRDPLPEPGRTPGAPHPDPLLASRGWHINEHGIYTRRATPEPQAPPQREPEAG